MTLFTVVSENPLLLANFIWKIFLTLKFCTEYLKPIDSHSLGNSDIAPLENTFFLQRFRQSKMTVINFLWKFDHIIKSHGKGL